MMMIAGLWNEEKLRKALEELMEYIKELKDLKSKSLYAPQVKKVLEMELESMVNELLATTGNLDSSKLDSLIAKYNKLVQIIESMIREKKFQLDEQDLKKKQEEDLAIAKERERLRLFIVKLAKEVEEALKEIIEARNKSLQERLQEIRRDIRKLNNDIKEKKKELKNAKDKVKSNYGERKKQYIEKYVKLCADNDIPATREEIEDIFNRCEQEVAARYPEWGEGKDVHYYKEVMSLVVPEVDGLVKGKVDAKAEEIEQEKAKEGIDPEEIKKLEKKLEALRASEAKLESDISDMQKDILLGCDNVDELDKEIKEKEEQIHLLEAEEKQIREELAKYGSGPLESTKGLEEGDILEDKLSADITTAERSDKTTSAMPSTTSDADDPSPPISPEQGTNVVWPPWTTRNKREKTETLENVQGAENGQEKKEDEETSLKRGP